MNSKISKVLRFSIGIIILFLLIYKIGFYKIIDILMSLDVLTIFSIILISFIIFLMSAVNLDLILRTINVKIKFYKLFSYALFGWAVGLFVPGKLGEFSIVYFFKKYMGLSEAIIVPLIDKIITFFALALLSIIGFFYFFEISIAYKLTFLIFFTAIIFSLFLTKTFRGFIGKILIKRYNIKLQNFFKLFTDIILNNKKIIFINFILTILKWGISAIIIYILFFNFGYNINLFLIILINSIVILVGLIPITINGLGIKQAVAIWIFTNHFSIPAEIVLSVYLVSLIINYVLAIIAFGIIRK